MKYKKYILSVKINCLKVVSSKITFKEIQLVKGHTHDAHTQIKRIAVKIALEFLPILDF